MTPLFSWFPELSPDSAPVAPPGGRILEARTALFPPPEALDRGSELPFLARTAGRGPLRRPRRWPSRARPIASTGTSERIRLPLSSEGSRISRTARQVPTSLQPARSGTARTPRRLLHDREIDRDVGQRLPGRGGSRRIAGALPLPIGFDRGDELGRDAARFGEQARRPEDEDARVPEVPGADVLLRLGRRRLLDEAQDLHPFGRAGLGQLQVAEVGLRARRRDREDDDRGRGPPPRRPRRGPAGTPRRRRPSGPRARTPSPGRRPRRNRAPPRGSAGPELRREGSGRMRSGGISGSSWRTRATCCRGSRDEDLLGRGTHPLVGLAQEALVREELQELLRTALRSRAARAACRRRPP